MPFQQQQRVESFVFSYPETSLDTHTKWYLVGSISREARPNSESESLQLAVLQMAAEVRALFASIDASYQLLRVNFPPR